VAYLARFDDDKGLRAFIQELVDGNCLLDGSERVARKLLEHGLAGVDAEEHALIEAEIIAPYCGSCEDCGNTPKWEEMLHTYDTGLCTACFTKLMKRAPAIPGVA